MRKQALYYHITAIFVLAAFLAQTFISNLIVIDYYANRSYFAVHCENKARPMMHCNGKCLMMKKLEQEEKKDNSQLKAENKIELICFQKNDYLVEPIYVLRISTYPGFAEEIPVNPHASIFHPPQV